MKTLLSLTLTILLSTQVVMANDEQTTYFHCYAQKFTERSGSFHLLVVGPFDIPIGTDYILTGVRKKTEAEVKRSIQNNIRQNQEYIEDEDYDSVIDETNINPIIEQRIRTFDKKESVAAYHQSLIKAQICPQEDLEFAK